MAVGWHPHEPPDTQTNQNPEPKPNQRTEPTVTGTIDNNLLADAAHLVIAADYGNENRVQRRLGLNPETAAAVMDSLETLGVVGPSRGAAPRDVLITTERADETAERIRRGD